LSFSEAAGGHALGHHEEAFGRKPPPEQFADGGCMARHAFLEAPVLDGSQFIDAQHNLQAFAAFEIRQYVHKSLVHKWQRPQRYLSVMPSEH
jgi:hypothetical protein